MTDQTPPTTAPMMPPFCVFNVAVTQFLGFYDEWDDAETAAARFGNCSFPYGLSDAERAAIAATRQGIFHSRSGFLPGRDGHPVTVIDWDDPVQQYEVEFTDGTRTYLSPAELTLTV